ncbi:MAG: RecX family transcriptional regulator [Dehalococcoidales bacterium]|nr:RecX family transcriptional regulator [Dehalococcoidales bacterium]MDP7525149.1 RecX family transcriptional regulator [Dehalococcoidales bacterium]
MRRITALRPGKGRGKRVNMFLNGKFAFSLAAEIVAKEGLEVEQELSDEQIEALTRFSRVSLCYNAAALFLGHRPRSEPELRDRLHQRGFDSDSVDAVVTRLKKQGLVDDTAFARLWKDNRESFSPRSQWLTRLELKRKGIAEDIIDQTVTTIDDEDSAYRAALKKARNLTPSDYQSFRRRVGEHLKRRGFSYGVINHAVHRIWQDQVGNSG